MEVEAKFAITGTLSPTSIEELDIRPYSLRSAGMADHMDTLLDTPDRRITGQTHALRVRSGASGLTLTLKGPNTDEGEVHARQEWEAPLTPPLCLDPKAWPEPIASQVAQLAGDNPLAPIFHVAVERRLWDVRRGARVIGELALDTGVILAAGRREPIHELELELKGSGARSDLDTLRQYLCAQLPLEPETRSKLQRGLALLLHARWTLDGYTPLDVLARHYIRHKARAMRKAERRVLKVGDPDAIHDMRVATRRIRSALRELELMGAFQSRELNLLRKRLRGVSRRLGAVRDLDIIMERIAAEVQPGGADLASPADEAVAGAIAQLQRRRKDAYADARRKIKRAKYTRLRKQLLRFDPGRDSSMGTGSCPLVRGYAGGAMWSRYEALLRHESAIDIGDTVEMHQARIAAKRLRYTLEMFAPALGRDIEPLRRALVEFQECFGALQDTTVTMRTLAALADCSDASPAWSQLTRQLESRAAELTRQARISWRSLTSEEIRRILARALAAL
jgi:inorganic triphosphatase YgiF